MSDGPTFVFMTCQVGAEPALKREVARAWPTSRFAFSRPGFLTFKVAPGKKLAEDFASQLVFARAAGFCLGKASGGTPQQRADLVWKLIGDRPVTQLHVWPRDRYSPGFRDYEPGMTAEVEEVERVIRQRSPQEIARILALPGNCRPCESLNSGTFSLLEPFLPPLRKGGPGGVRQAALGAAGSDSKSFDEHKSKEFLEHSQSRQTTSPEPPCPPLLRGGDVTSALVVDVVVVDETEWWVGYHRIHSLASSRPGGFCNAALPSEVVSRAYLKMQEAILWSGFDFQAGERCVEIGSAPGGASQFLLARGLDVIGIDPAVMDPVVLADPHFRHIRKRSKEVPRSEFLGVDWLTCDVNLPPNYTLDAAKAIVGHPGVKFKGLLLTLKLVDWSLAEELPMFLARIRSWGFKNIRARQLHHNRQEICVAASGFRESSSQPDRKSKTIRVRPAHARSSGPKGRTPDRRRKRRERMDK